jgi:hypothetical protein
MKISYAITVCNEFVEIQKLVSFLLKHKRHEDEIVILYDKKNGHEGVEEYLRTHSVNNEFCWYGKEFNDHFADWKNYLNSLCNGDYIFQIDADEIPNEKLVETLPSLLEGNSSIDLFLVPRVNTVEGLTDEHINKWRWNVNDKGWVNWPDYQMRLYRNSDDIVWQNKVHEVITNTDTHTELPMNENFALYHPKEIKRQEKQNEYYSTL